MRKDVIKSNIFLERDDIPFTTGMGSRKRNIVCFQWVGVPAGPVVKNTSESGLREAMPSVAEANRPSVVKNVSKCPRKA